MAGRCVYYALNLLFDSNPFPKGNYLQLFNPNAWKFHQSIVKKCNTQPFHRKDLLTLSSLDGSAIRVHGPFGVSRLLFPHTKPGTHLGQTNGLYTYDPKAMQAVLVNVGFSSCETFSIPSIFLAESRRVRRK